VESLSADVRELVMKMLILNPAKRISIPDILSHKWLAVDSDLDDLDYTCKDRLLDTEGFSYEEVVDLKSLIEQEKIENK
jgi:serine/threonine protein kinase